MNLSYVWVDLTAWHTDPNPDPTINEGRHQHTWRVTASFDAAVPRDARSMKASLALILGPWQGRDLPADLWRGEDLARAVLQLHGNADCVGVRVERAEGFGATAGICA